MSKSRRDPFRPKLSIEPSGYAKGHGHTFGYSGTIGYASGGMGCVQCTSLAAALSKYWGWLERLNYPIIDSLGNVVRPAEIKKASVDL